MTKKAKLALGKLLREAKELAGLKLVWAAQLAGLDAYYLLDFEEGMLEPSHAQLDALAKVYRVSAESFAGRDPHPELEKVRV